MALAIMYCSAILVVDKTLCGVLSAHVAAASTITWQARGGSVRAHTHNNTPALRTHIYTGQRVYAHVDRTWARIRVAIFAHAPASAAALRRPPGECAKHRPRLPVRANGAARRGGFGVRHAGVDFFAFTLCFFFYKIHFFFPPPRGPVFFVCSLPRLCTNTRTSTCLRPMHAALLIQSYYVPPNMASSGELGRRPDSFQKRSISKNVWVVQIFPKM